MRSSELPHAERVDNSTYSTILPLGETFPIYIRETTEPGVLVREGNE